MVDFHDWSFADGSMDLVFDDSVAASDRAGIKNANDEDGDDGL